ncbi:hypothetical protein, partial [Aetokthonos hydrillicola]|uniref:hypothetical protein n=1 Tax=Aetokthonos hydrillicola TaxID=1550245 RepID=UPI001ABA3F1F
MSAESAPDEDLDNCLTSKAAETTHILLGHNLCMLQTRPECGNVDVFQRRLERIENQPVRAITDRVYVLL